MNILGMPFLLFLLSCVLAFMILALVITVIVVLVRYRHHKNLLLAQDAAQKHPIGQLEQVGPIANPKTPLPAKSEVKKELPQLLTQKAQSVIVPPKTSVTDISRVKNIQESSRVNDTRDPILNATTQRDHKPQQGMPELTFPAFNEAAKTNPNMALLEKQLKARLESVKRKETPPIADDYNPRERPTQPKKLNQGGLYPSTQQRTRKDSINADFQPAASPPTMYQMPRMNPNQSFYPLAANISATTILQRQEDIMNRTMNKSILSQYDD